MRPSRTQGLSGSLLSSISHSNKPVLFTTIKLCHWESSYAFATQSVVLGPEHYHHPKACYKCRILSPVQDLLIRTCISIRSPNDSYAHESLGSTDLYPSMSLFTRRKQEEIPLLVLLPPPPLFNWLNLGDEAPP